MSTSHTASMLNPCDCCEVVIPQASIHNRPGLPALTYRVGTHSAFLKRMLARLPEQIIKGGPTLIDLTTRSTDDLSIALLDACATMADLLTFYQERIANEGYLRTSTERRSILELARSIGYELNPGVAASTYLAFKVEEAEGAPERTKIKNGVKVISIPGQDEKPQTFETTEEIEARVDWNAIKAQQTESHDIGKPTTSLYLKGVDTLLEPSDAILLVGKDRASIATGDTGSERWDFRILQTVETFPKENYTLVTWKEDLGHEKPDTKPADEPKVFAFRRRVSLFGYNAPDWTAMSKDIKTNYVESYNKTDPAPTTPSSVSDKNWPDFKIRTVAEKQIHLDSDYPEILEDAWLVLVDKTLVELYKVKEVITEGRTDFTLTGKSTRLTLDTDEHLKNFGLRETVVYAQSEQLELGDVPMRTPVFGTKIILEEIIDGLNEGQTVAISGKQVEHVKVASRTHIEKVGKTEVICPGEDLILDSEDGTSSASFAEGDLLEIVAPPLLKVDGSIQWKLMDENGFEGIVTTQPKELIPEPAEEDDETVSEIGFINRLANDGERTTLILEDPLGYTYYRTTVSINANVTTGTHGETVEEILGSGDGTKAHQRFSLKKPPLTYVSAPTPSGGESTLEIRVNDVAWKEETSLYPLDANRRNYIVQLSNGGDVSAIFGNGIKGVRPSTGVENIKARYRTGIGPEGEVEANTLTLMQTRPFGVREVTNPIEASGAAAQETLDQARANAPLTVLTFDRIVSLKDFEDFARAFSGIGKAKAEVLWDGSQRKVHITVAADRGAAVKKDSILDKNLVQAIDKVRDPMQIVQVDSYEPLTFKVDAALLIDSAYETPKVENEVKARLEAEFNFGKRSLGQAVTATEIVAFVQDVDGVVAIDLNKLYIVEDVGASVSTDFSSQLVAKIARLDSGVVMPAQLIRLASGGVSLSEMIT